MRYLSLIQLPSVSGYFKILQLINTFALFNADNPTGRWVLELSNGRDFAVARRLAIIDNFETLLKQRQKRFDTSQLGNASQARNITYCDKPLPAPTLYKWNMPESGVLQLDYSSAKRAPPSEVRTLSDENFGKILTMIGGGVRPELRVQDSQISLRVLRTVSHLLYLRACQLRRILNLQPTEAARCDCFVMFFNMVVDPQNEKLYRVRIQDSSTMQELRDRLGYVTSFPFVQPEQIHFRLDLKYNDQRVATSFLVALAGKESAHNLHEPSHAYGGKVDYFPMGVPRSWEDPRKVPSEGIFQVTYICAPEYRKIMERKKLMEEFGGWTTTISGPDDVLWCSGISEVPPDVLNVLIFLMSQFDNLKEAFKAIDGPVPNERLTLRKFESSVLMKCRRLGKGEEAHAKLKEVFRYLDPGGEGTVSPDEWALLDQLWRELSLSILEFLQFCDRIFGKDNLDEVWEFLDADGSGCITGDEWTPAVFHNLGYFGPSIPIFNYLDQDFEGTISRDEFEHLEEFKHKQRDNLRSLGFR